MKNILKYAIGGSVAMLFVGALFVSAKPANALFGVATEEAELKCSTVKLFTASWCGPCKTVKKDAAGDIKILGDQDPSAIAQCDFSNGPPKDQPECTIDGNDVPQLHVTDPDGTVTIYRGSKDIIEQLKKVAACYPKESTGTMGEVPISDSTEGASGEDPYNLLSARGISSSILDSISAAFSWVFSSIANGFMALIDLVTGQ